MDNYVFHGLDASSPLNPEELREHAHLVVNFIADYYKNIEEHSVCSRVEPGYLRKRLPETAPREPETLDAILDDAKHKIVPGLTHWQSPNFFAYFPASASTAGFLGEMLCNAFNVIAFNWASSPAATELESVVLDWIAQMLELPKSFMFPKTASNRRPLNNELEGGGGGVLHGSTCEAILCTMVAARDGVLRKIGFENITKLVVYGSDQTHFCLEKAARISGIRPENFKALPTSAASGFALQSSVVQGAMHDDAQKGLIPFYLCATVGTTGLCSVDPLKDLGIVAKEYGAWMHVDAAYAGNACVCPEFRHFLDGVEYATSLSVNLHKWLLTNLSCCCLWIQDSGALITALSSDPVYLNNSASEAKMVVDYKDWQISLTRRFQAIKVWLVIRRHGVDNLREHIRSHVKLAAEFEKLVSSDERFEVFVPRKFALVCFRLKAGGKVEETNRLNRRLLREVNSSGKLYITSHVVNGTYLLRFTVGATLTEERHVLAAWRIIQEQADLIYSPRSLKFIGVDQKSHPFLLFVPRLWVSYAFLLCYRYDIFHFLDSTPRPPFRRTHPTPCRRSPASARCNRMRPNAVHLELRPDVPPGATASPPPCQRSPASND